MLAAYRRVRRHFLRGAPKSAKPRRPARQDYWKTVQRRAFMRRYGSALEVRGECHRCSGPVAEAMQVCPWCGVKRRISRDEHRFMAVCPRCKRSLKTDWRFCPWCYGAAVNPDSLPRYSDYRYAGRCPNSACRGRQLMPFMRYCPWCRRKVQRLWAVEGSNKRCSRCRWGIVPEHWSFCPWCGKRLERR
jgi:RNA polymerase subunit RPABC4/transcription elongation factor Spt4